MGTESRQVVVVTGISGNLGRTLTKLLHRTERIIGIDRRPFPAEPKDVEMFQLDLRKKKAEDVFRKNDVKAVIHMGIMHDPRMSAEEHHSFNVVGTTRVLDALREVRGEEGRRPLQRQRLRPDRRTTRTSSPRTRR